MGKNTRLASPKLQVARVGAPNRNWRSPYWRHPIRLIEALTGAWGAGDAVCELNGQFIIECFQNTRARSITGPKAAAVWQDFDLAWSRLSES